MAEGFSVTRKGLEARFEREELALLRELIADLALRMAPEPPDENLDPLVALTGIAGAPVPTPTDPILQRLFPDVHKADAEIAAQFRQFADADQKAARLAAYDSVLEDLAAADDGKVRLSQDQAEIWLRVVNDLRLATGTVADVSEDWDHDVESLDEDDPRVAFLHLYDWLTWLQSRLLGALTG